MKKRINKFRINKFKKYKEEKKSLLRGFFEKLGYDKLTFTGDYNIIDGFYEDQAGIRHYFEANVRQFSRHKYNNYLIEKDKVMALLGYFQKGAIIEYINFFAEPDQTYSTIIFDLGSRVMDWGKQGKDVEDVFVMQHLPQHTASNSGLVEKEVTFLTVGPYDVVYDIDIDINNEQGQLQINFNYTKVG